MMTSTMPTTPAVPNTGRLSALRRVAGRLGVRLPVKPVCKGHCAPGEFLASWTYDRPPLSLVLGPRGGGKSYLSALATHIDSCRHRRHSTVILGGSEAQSKQIFDALVEFDRSIEPGKPSPIVKRTATGVKYDTLSTASYIPASPKSVRGPHVPSLRLDEIDEIEPDIRESAMGMCMERRGYPAMIAMTSTYHRVGGPMAGLLEDGRSGRFPLYTFCIFDVLERCTDERSGPNLERCPDCPLMKWCHDERGAKAKRSNGHYAIDSLIQKVRAVSGRVFEADYLCTGPRADGVWFRDFGIAKHVSADDAEYDPALPVYVGVDTGVHTGAVFYQAWQEGDTWWVNVFADYLSEGRTAENQARDILDVARVRCEGRIDSTFTDPAGTARTAVGPSVLSCYAQAGLTLRPWADHNPSVVDSLARLEGLLMPADGVPRLMVHPRCESLIHAFRTYQRAKRGGVLLDYPKDPQHETGEDMIDALRGGLLAVVWGKIKVW